MDTTDTKEIVENLGINLKKKLNEKKGSANLTTSHLSEEATVARKKKRQILKQEEDQENIQTKTRTKIAEKKLLRAKNKVKSGLSEEFYKNANIPIRFKQKTLSNFVGKESKEKAKKLVLDNKSVFITGSWGLGKTHLGIALLMEWFANTLQNEEQIDGNYKIVCSRGFPLFLPATELFLRLKNSFDTKTETEKDILDSLDRKDLLMLDDLGTDKVSEWSKQIIYTLIDRRYRNVKPIIITSNLSLKEIADVYDGRVASRLIEMGGVIDLKGRDKRIDATK